jgi:hypothetical protein
MSFTSIKLVPEELRSLAFGGIGAGYMGIGAAFSNPIRILNVQNLTDATMVFSFGGVTDHFVLPAQGFILLDVSTNKDWRSGALYIAEGSRLYVKQEAAAPTSGSVYVSVFYGAHT